MVPKSSFAFIDEALREFRGRFFKLAFERLQQASMKKILMLFAAVALVGAAAGCNQSNTANENPADTNSTVQNAEQGASNAWQDTKGAATNAWNATKDGATNAWNKTTNAVSGGSQ